MSYKVLICGCRNYSDFDKIFRIMKKAKDVTIISGGAKGTDSLAVRVAEFLRFEFIVIYDNMIIYFYWW